MEDCSIRSLRMFSDSRKRQGAVAQCSFADSALKFRLEVLEFRSKVVDQGPIGSPGRAIRLG